MSGRGSLVAAWDRLAGDGGRALRVQRLQRAELDEALIDDDDLPQLGSATVFWAWPEAAEGAPGWVLRAVRIADDGSSAPFLVRARRLRLKRPDPNLLSLLGLDRDALPASVRLEGSARPMEEPPRHLACICRMTGSEEIYRAIEAGWRTVDELKRATGAAFGECQGRRCVPGLALRLDLAPGQPRGSITPRPPLVPVPAAVLAAFADEPADEPAPDS